MENSAVMRSMLFDFYGELLTDKQREYFDLRYNEDLSLGEIAEQCGISRQGVWDIIRRAEAAMSEIEEKRAYKALGAQRPDRRTDTRACGQRNRCAYPQKARRIKNIGGREHGI